MKKGLYLLPFLLLLFSGGVLGLTIIANDATFINVPWNESVTVANSTNLTLVNNSFTDEFILVNSSGIEVQGGEFNQSSNTTADNMVFDGVSYLDDVAVIDSTNITYVNCLFYGDFTTLSSSDIVAIDNFWNTNYAPLNGVDGCSDGDGGTVSSDVTVAPWYRAVGLTDSSSNCNPIFTAIEDQAGNLGYEWTDTAICTDPNENDTIVYTDNTTLFTTDAGTGVMTYTPTGVVYEAIRITCSDAEFTDTEDFLFTTEAGTGYITAYVSADIAESSIDNIIIAVTTLASIMSVIIIVFVGKWFKGTI